MSSEPTPPDEKSAGEEPFAKDPLYNNYEEDFMSEKGRDYLRGSRAMSKEKPLEEQLAELRERHEALRTVYHSIPEDLRYLAGLGRFQRYMNKHYPNRQRGQESPEPPEFQTTATKPPEEPETETEPESSQPKRRIKLLI